MFFAVDARPIVRLRSQSERRELGSNAELGPAKSGNKQTQTHEGNDRTEKRAMRRLLLFIAVAGHQLASARLAVPGGFVSRGVKVVKQCEADPPQHIMCVQTYLFSTTTTPVSLGIEGVGPLVQGVSQLANGRTAAPQIASATMELNFTTTSGAIKKHTQAGVDFWNSSTSEMLIAVHEHGDIENEYGYMAVRTPRVSYAGTVSYVNLLSSNQAFYYKDWDKECLEVEHGEYVVRKYFTSESGVTNTFIGIYSDPACSRKLSVSKKCTVYAGGIYYAVVSGDTAASAKVSKFGESKDFCKSDDGDEQGDTETIILVACIFGGIGLLVGGALIMAQMKKRQLRELELEEAEKAKPPSQDEIQARMISQMNSVGKIPAA